MNMPYILRRGIESRPLDYTEQQQVERDICLLYHQLSEYSFIMGDLEYGSVFSMPYWDYLEIGNLSEYDTAFIRNGCLVMILAMAWDVIDGSGSYLVKEDRLSSCVNAIDNLELTAATSQEEPLLRLLQIVRTALGRAKTEADLQDEKLFNDCYWVHDRYIKGYFREKTQDFAENPYFKGKAG